MTEILNHTYENGSEGAAANASPWTVNGGANAWDAMEAGVTITSDSKAHGAFGIKSPNAASGYAYKNFTGTKTASYRTSLKPLGDPVVSGDVYLYRLGIGGTMYIGIRVVTTTGKLRVQDYGGVTYTATNPLTANEEDWLEINVDSGTNATDGKIHCAYYSKDSSTPIQTLVNLTNINAGAGALFTRAYGLKYGAAGPAWGFDDIVMTDSFATIGPPPTNVSPSLSLSADKSTIYAGEYSTITATASDPDGSIASLSWSTNVGALVGSGSTRQLIAPPSNTDQTATVQVIATDNLGATNTQTINISCKASMRHVKIGGIWVPSARRIRLP